jgi:D-beta-D-heptose 7-phosphate kinase/D-beta-D-heptose 1-phosphate adenosyltransferase
MNAEIVSIERAAGIVRSKRESDPDLTVVTTSGGFDPIHVGHLRCIQEAARLKGERGILIVIVNGDGFLARKKGYSFMKVEERLELVSAIRGVDYVVTWDDGGQFVTGAIEALLPNVFAKGGDRSSSAVVPEFEACTRIGCSVVFGVGGNDKVQSSSELVARTRP